MGSDLLHLDNDRVHPNLVVQKMGGSLLDDVDHIQMIARRVADNRRTGKDIILVVSALKGETNRLLGLCATLSPDLSPSERDVVASAGEQVSVGLLTMALRASGVPARSFLAHQVRIITDSNYGDARVLAVETDSVRESLNRGEIPVVAGFQGITAQGEITTLGRGGSDTTAVALSAALGAARCEFYKDVGGIFTTDPSVCDSARPITRLSYPQMLELTSLGAKVLHPRSVALAQRHRVLVHVKGSIGDGLGTQIENDDDVADNFALTSESRALMSTDSRVSRISLVTSRFFSQNSMEARMTKILKNIQIPVLQTCRSQLSVTCEVPFQSELCAMRAIHDGIELGNGLF
jgi:aspartate kinase